MSYGELQRFGTNNAVLPKEGPKVFPFTLDFTVKNLQELDLTLAIEQGWVSFISGIYIDNAINAANISVTTANLGQRVTCPSLSQAYFPLFVTDNPRLTINTTAAPNLLIPVFVVNFPVDALTWKVA